MFIAVAELAVKAADFSRAIKLLFKECYFKAELHFTGAERDRGGS